MKYKKIIRPQIIHKIARDMKKAVKKLSVLDAIQYCIENNPNCTDWEHSIGVCKVIEPQIKNNLEAKFKYGQYKNKINRSLRYVDEEIIAKPHEGSDLQGNLYKFSFVKFASGKDAEEAAERCKPQIHGWKEKEKRLVDKSRDSGIKKRLEAERKRRLLLVNS